MSISMKKSSALGSQVTAENANQSTAKKGATARNAAISLAFPPLSADPSANLTQLRDESSAYAVVAKTCLQLTQYAGFGSSVQIEDTSSVCSSDLFHDPSFARIISTCFQALMECIKNHNDRRCRLLACKTLGILARSAYARIRHSPYLFSNRDGTNTRLEDEVGAEIPSALATAALMDADDGVSASALQALGMMALSSSFATSTLVEDELLTQIQTIATSSTAPYAPSLRSCVDEDASIPLHELPSRIYENILGPRLLQLLDRVAHYQATSHMGLALPVLTACLVYQSKTVAASSFGMDRTTFSKRWVDIDVAGLCDTFVTAILLPALSVHTDGCLGHSAALSALRLANCRPTQTWVVDVARWACICLKEEVVATQTLETKMAAMAAFIIALRPLSMAERVPWLIWVAEEVTSLPTTTSVPCEICTAGVTLEWQGAAMTRRPARVGFWTEIALHFFLDGPALESLKRPDALKQFLSSPLASSIMAANGKARDEVLLAFTTVAIEAGRRFREAVGGWLQETDPGSPDLTEWLKLARVVLTAFSGCVHTGPKSAFLEEDMSLTTAGLASFTQLLQEYLHMAGLLLPAASVALKMAANACPPHILWDRLTESAQFLSKFEGTDLGVMDRTTKLTDELVAREKRAGIVNHHMRVYVLALAADHWVQARSYQVVKSKGDITGLAATSGLEIVTALSPKRLLGKIFEAHGEEDKGKKDPVKKLGAETVRLSVACIESITLTACDWRRRFGSSNEVKSIVKTSVQVLQGRGDDGALDDRIKALMGPLCEAAVGRIQSFYEGEGGSGLPPLSELVLQPVKTKIKPLVSSAKPTSGAPEDALEGHYTQLCRQVATARIAQCLLSNPAADAYLANPRPINWLRLSVPPIGESKDGRQLGLVGPALSAWNTLVTQSSASSDAAQLVTACTPVRVLRYDGEDEFRLAAIIRVFNITSVDFVDGLRLEFGLVRSVEPDPVSVEVAESMGCRYEELAMDTPLTSSTAEYRQEIKAGEHITWRVTFDVPETPGLALLPSIVYRNVGVESDDAGARWVGGKSAGAGEASTAGGESKSGEDDFQVKPGSADTKTGDSSEIANVTLSCEPLSISPVVGLQPCPLVFFRDRWGDVDSFRFLWFRAAYQIVPIRIADPPDQQSKPAMDAIAMKIASMSRLTWDGEAIPGGYATRVWAFMSLSGKRILCLLAQSDSDNAAEKSTLYLRGDCKATLFAVAGSKVARKAMVTALVPGKVPIGDLSSP